MTTGFRCTSSIFNSSSPVIPFTARGELHFHSSKNNGRDQMPFEEMHLRGTSVKTNLILKMFFPIVRGGGGMDPCNLKDSRRIQMHFDLQSVAGSEIRVVRASEYTSPSGCVFGMYIQVHIQCHVIRHQASTLDAHLEQPAVPGPERRDGLLPSILLD